MDYNPPGSSVHGILQARILGSAAMPSYRGTSWPRDQTHVSCLASGFFTTGLPGKDSPHPHPYQCYYISHYCPLDTNLHSFNKPYGLLTAWLRMIFQSHLLRLPVGHTPWPHQTSACSLNPPDLESPSPTSPRHTPTHLLRPVTTSVKLQGRVDFCLHLSQHYVSTSLTWWNRLY